MSFRGNYKSVPQDVDDSAFSARYRSTSGTCGMFMRFFLDPMGRKIQNGVYLLAYAAMIALGTYYEDPNAAFKMYWSPFYAPLDAGSLQVEWITIIFAGSGFITSLWKVMNFMNHYEMQVKDGYVFMNWLQLAITSAAILSQLFVMECNKSWGYICCFILLIIAWVGTLAVQEHQNPDYAKIKDVSIAAKPWEDNGMGIRGTRLKYFAFSTFLIFGAISLLVAQGVYDGIKGTQTPPDFLKAYIAVTVFFVVVIQIHTGYSIWKAGAAETQEQADDCRFIHEALFMAILFLWCANSIGFVFPGMRNNNELAYCESTPLTTVN